MSVTVRPRGKGVTVELPGSSTLAIAAAARAEGAAAVAVAAGGPNYADTAAGLAATAVGETFAVDNSNGYVTIYLHEAGPTATYLRTMLKDASSPNAAALIGYRNSNAKVKIDDWRTPRDYGNEDTGNGVVGDTTAINAMIASDKRHLVFPDASFVSSGLHSITKHNQRIVIEGDLKYDGLRRRLSGSSDADPDAVFGFQGMFRVQDGTEGVVIEGCGTVDGNWRRAGATTDQPLHFRDLGAGVYAYRAPGFRCEGITFTRMPENGLKMINCPWMDIANSTKFVDICNVGSEVHSYALDPRTNLPWTGDVAAPSGRVGGFYDWIDDGEQFLNYGNGVGILIHCAEDALAASLLEFSGHFRDCLAAIWSENNSNETLADMIGLYDIFIQGNYRGVSQAMSMNGIGMIGVRRVRGARIIMNDVANALPVDDPETPAEDGNTAGLHIVECDDVRIDGLDIITNTGTADRLQYGARIVSSDNVTLLNTNISGQSREGVIRATGGSAPTNVRMINVVGADADDAWSGGLMCFRFSRANPGPDATVKMLVNGVTGAEDAVMPCAGRIVSSTARAGDGQVFAGSCTITPRINGVAETDMALVSASATGHQGTFATVDGSSQATASRDGLTGVQMYKGDRIGGLLQTGGTFDSVHDITWDVWVDPSWKG